jgi:signal transduction histidine kinase
MAELATNPPLETAFRDYEREVRIHNYRVACILAMIFMPAGGMLDYFYLGKQYPDTPELVRDFFLLRLLCSALLLFIWWVVRTPFGMRNHTIFGQVVAALPSFFISWMIYLTQGAESPYYAGISLVLLGAGLVLRWTLLDSILVVVTALMMYVAACVTSPGVSITHAWESGIFFNNMYFLLVTAVFVIIGNFFYNRIRFREFALRYELDQNRRELEESNQKLLELDEAKSRFFANISHELRTPLTLLIAPVETLLNRENLDTEVRNLLNTMHGNGMRLLKLINDLLDLVRLESGRMTLRRDPVTVEPFIKGVASAARQVADDKRLHLDVQVDPALGTILTDRDKLDKIILNLVFNAIKFTPAGGRITIAAEKQKDRFVMNVSDTGMGISEKNLPYIFDRFWQADGSSKRKYQGVGIGLALVKEFVTLQGGTVTVRSAEGQGTTFTVSLPYVPGRPEETQKTPVDEPAQKALAPAKVSSEDWLLNLYRRAEFFPALSPATSSIRPVETGGNDQTPVLLMADDEPDMLRFLKSQLSGDYKVLEAIDGQQAIEKATHFLPDIILLDMMMPEKDGLQACREIRDLTPTHNIPIILLTARADEETKMAALAAGASDFLAKPFSTAELKARIRNLVERHAFQRQLSRQNMALESTNDRLKDTIEQLKETELQLIQTEKLASLGRMSAGIIHEINNPLNYANTGLMVLRKKGAALGPEHQEDFMDVLKDIEEGIGRVQNIVTDLRTFSHKNGEIRESVQLAEAVQFALRFLSHELKENIELRQEIPNGLRVMANKNLLIQVLVNLVKNSIDAVGVKSYPEGQSPAIDIRARLEGETVNLVVADNGCGIEKQHLVKIFDPFFTTKDQGQGMGLGLSLCYRIVESFSGTITVRTEAGEFCEFTLKFPKVLDTQA